MIYCNLDNFHVSKEDLKNSPSRYDGVSEEADIELRNFGTTLIQEGGTLLDVPQVVMATGQVLFHRFYCKKSMAKYDVESVAMTATWLACKLEEEPRHSRHLLAVFHRLQRRRLKEPLKVLDYYSKEFAATKLDMLHMETIMLKEFGFIVHVDHPHKLVLNHVNLLHVGVKDPQAKKKLMQEAYNLTNDSLRTTLCVRFKSETVACGLIFMAARRLQVALPTQPPWYQLFDVRFEDICEVCCEMQALYARPKAQYIDVREEKQASAMSVQPTPQASPVTANGQPSSQADAPSSPPLVQEDSAPRSEEAPEAKQGHKQDPLPNGGSHGAEKAAAGKEEEQRPIKSDRQYRKQSRERKRERFHRDRDRDYARERERERDRDQDRSGGHDSRMRTERQRPSQADYRDRRDPDRRPDREREREAGDRKQGRSERSSSAAANGRSSRSPRKHSRHPIDWAAYKRGRDTDDPGPEKHRDAPMDDRERAPRQDAKRGRRDRSYSTSEERD